VASLRKKGETSNEERKMELRAIYHLCKAHLRPLLFLLLAFLTGCLAAGLFFTIGSDLSVLENLKQNLNGSDTLITG